MEIANKKQQGGGFMKSKLVMSFYRAAKPSISSGQYAATKVEYPEASCAVHKVSLAKPGGGFAAWDGYLHGPEGVGGDEQVDTKATSYIHQVKERRRLEELNIMKDGLCD